MNRSDEGGGGGNRPPQLALVSCLACKLGRVSGEPGHSRGKKRSRCAWSRPAYPAQVQHSDQFLHTGTGRAPRCVITRTTSTMTTAMLDYPLQPVCRVAQFLISCRPALAPLTVCPMRPTTGRVQDWCSLSQQPLFRFAAGQSVGATKRLSGYFSTGLARLDILRLAIQRPCFSLLNTQSRVSK